jgi:electron-transferring-flavoprotein dehydrogenase
MTGDTPEAGVAVERQSMDVDIVCVGFGPAAGGFLTTLVRGMVGPDGNPLVQSRAQPGMPLQVMCYERADDVGFGVSGVVTKARAIRQSFPDLDPGTIPMAAPVTHEKVVYLLDPVGASHRSATVRAADAAIRALKFALPVDRDAMELPWTPAFLHKEGGLILSMGQFTQWVGQQVMGSGLVQVWPGTPVSAPLVEGKRVAGVRLMDQGTDAKGQPGAGYMPGMDVRASLTVVADGPVGAVGRAIDREMGVPNGHAVHEWAVGSKFVVELPENTELKPGFVLHTMGFPEPEIFGFLYVHPDRLASVGIFVPSWLDNPVRTSYRYLQHYVQHPYLWRWLKGGKLRSWGAKSLLESGKRGEPFLCGDGYARIGEGSGTTNVLTGSGVDEAWMSGVLLGESVLQLLKADQPFTRENLELTYVAKRASSWLEKEAEIARTARDGFDKGFVPGVMGMGVTGITDGALSFPAEPRPTHKRLPSLDEYYEGRIREPELGALKEECAAKGLPFHDALMDRVGWPPIPYDGELLVSHQDALLMGGKVQAPSGFADHVRFLDAAVCKACTARVCVDMCSGEAIRPGPEGVPTFDRDKCVHCGACMWNCSKGENIDFRAGTGGLHSAEN